MNKLLSREKISAISLSAVMALGLSACKNTEEEAPTLSDKSTTVNVKVGHTLWDIAGEACDIDNGYDQQRIAEAIAEYNGNPSLEIRANTSIEVPKNICEVIPGYSEE